MSYNFDLSLEENNSVGNLLKRISPNSKVLEFGCAHGRMTAYMCNELNCEVYIVEYDQDGFDDAMKYAADGLCDDILNYRWVEQFSAVQFDYIIFADVLEHLYNPIDVLKKAKALLKDSGSILTSIPNIAHNDILANLFYNQFEYTQYGLLDNTHIRFFAEGMLDNFFAKAGYVIVDKDATFALTGTTEQAKVCQKKVTDYMKKLLDSRENGTVYQFILQLRKCECAEAATRTLQSKNRQSLFTRVYYRGAEGFSEDRISNHKVEQIADGHYRVNMLLDIKDDVKVVRIDPVEGEPCVIDNFRVSVDSGTANISLQDSITNGVPVLLNSNDPQIICDILEPVNGTVEVSFDFYLMGETYVKKLHEIIEKMSTCKEGN